MKFFDWNLMIKYKISYYTNYFTISNILLIRSYRIPFRSSDNANIRKVILFEVLTYRVSSPNTGYLPNTGFWPLYTMLSHFAAFGRTKN